MKTLTPPFSLGVIFGNRDFFPDKLVAEARADLTKLLGELGIAAVMLDPAETKLGGVETHSDARKCADLFKRHRDTIGGVLVCLPNFGDEKGVADTLKLAGLNVPVLVQGYPDDLDRLDVIRRRDAFCGKSAIISARPASLTRSRRSTSCTRSTRRSARTCCNS
jgi:L-fucose isomerase-like protein